MLETVVVLKPKAEWRAKKQWYSEWAPGWLKKPLGQIWPEHISFEELKTEMTHALQLPGYAADSWTMPIKGRIDMLSTGIRSPLGVKIFGDNLDEIQRLGVECERSTAQLEGTGSVFAERAAGGYFVDFVPNREALARYGLTVDDLQAVIMTAVGGETIATPIEGRQRFTVNLRYPRDLRQEVDQLERVLVKAGMDGIQVPMKQLATIKLATGAALLRRTGPTH